MWRDCSRLFQYITALDGPGAGRVEVLFHLLERARQPLGQIGRQHRGVGKGARLLPAGEIAIAQAVAPGRDGLALPVHHVLAP